MFNKKGLLGKIFESLPVLIFVIVFTAIFIFLAVGIAYMKPFTAPAHEGGNFLTEEVLFKNLSINGEEEMLGAAIVRAYKGYKFNDDTYNKASNMPEGKEKEELVNYRNSLLDYSNSLPKSYIKAFEEENFKLFEGRPSCFILITDPISNPTSKNLHESVGKLLNRYYKFENGKSEERFSGPELEKHFTEGKASRVALYYPELENYGGNDGLFVFYIYYGECAK